jgi:hypothetical protein
MKIRKIAAIALLGTLTFSGASAILPTLINPQLEVAQASGLTFSPNKNRYPRLEYLTIEGRFAPYAAVQVSQVYTHETLRRDITDNLGHAYADANGVVRFQYQVPGDPMKDNVRVVMRCHNNSQQARIPIGR